MGRRNSGGRGGGRGYNNRNANSAGRGNGSGYSKKKKELTDYWYYTGNSNQATNFETTNDFILNHILSEFEQSQDIYEDLRLLRETDTDSWKKFIEWQGHKVYLNIIYQDNTSTMKLAINGKASSGKRTRHFDIKLFYVTDLVERQEVNVIYCPTDIMIGDYMSKPLTGSKFKVFRKLIMNL